MKYQNYIFDLYGTLVDILTNEDGSLLWEWAAMELKAKYRTNTSAMKLQEDYLRICKEEEDLLAQENGSLYPEIQVEKVWSRILDGSCTAQEVCAFCKAFREMSRAKLEVYPGVKEVFQAIRAAGGRIFLLSNAQWIYTEEELKICGLTNSFDDIFISSDYGRKKPDHEFLAQLLSKHHLAVSETVMIGNEVAADVGIATSVGMDAIYLNRDGQTMAEIKDALLASHAKLNHVVVAKNGDIRLVLRAADIPAV